MALLGSGSGFVFKLTHWLVYATAIGARVGDPSRPDGGVSVTGSEYDYAEFRLGCPVYVTGISSIPPGAWNCQ